MSDFISVVGDKSLDKLSHTDVLDYVDWLDGRVDESEIVAKTANKYISHNSKMIKEIKLRLGLPEFFASMRLQGVVNVSRPPFPIEFVRSKILAEGALMGLNAEARGAVFVIADSGLRLSEAINLNATTIHLDCDIPHGRPACENSGFDPDNSAGRLCARRHEGPSEGLSARPAIRALL